MALVIRKLKSSFGSRVQILTCNTGQHKELIAMTLRAFADVKVDVNFNVMTENQRLAATAGRMLSFLDDLIAHARPSMVLVQGDTSTALVASVAAFFNGVACGHIEAGLRTKDIHNPFPEEFNRKVIGVTSRLNFAVSPLSAGALLAEGADASTVHVVGNPVVDAVMEIASRKPPPPLAQSILSSQKRDARKRLILLTAHRRESFGAPMRAIFEAVAELAAQFEDVEFLFPVHPNPQVKGPAHQILSHVPRVHLVDPFPYEALVHIMKECALILTDSGGIQEEASVFGIPVLVMRKVTERMEGVKAGVASLVGLRKDLIVQAVSSLMSDTSGARAKLRKMRRKVFPYGDGLASSRIVDVIAGHLNLKPPAQEVEQVCPEKRSAEEQDEAQLMWRHIQGAVYPRNGKLTVRLRLYSDEHRACLERIAHRCIPGVEIVPDRGSAAQVVLIARDASHCSIGDDEIAPGGVAIFAGACEEEQMRLLSSLSFRQTASAPDDGVVILVRHEGKVVEGPNHHQVKSTR